MMVRITVPEGRLLVIRGVIWSHCGFVPNYRVVIGPEEVEIESEAFRGWNETVTLLEPGESTEAAEARNTEDWEHQDYKIVRITNQDGKPLIETVDQGRLDRID